MEFSAKQIAQFISGRIEGDENVSVNTFSKIEDGKTGSITFLANPKYVHFLYETNASIVLVDEAIEVKTPVKPTIILSKMLAIASQNSYNYMLIWFLRKLELIRWHLFLQLRR